MALCSINSIKQNFSCHFNYKKKYQNKKMYLNLAMRNKAPHLLKTSYLKSSKLPFYPNWQSKSSSSSLHKPPTEVSQSLLSLFETKSIACNGNWKFTCFIYNICDSYKVAIYMKLTDSDVFACFIKQSNDNYLKAEKLRLCHCSIWIKI